MTTEPSETIGSELAAERLCMALLKLETDTPGGLNALKAGLALPIAQVDADYPNLASVWRRFADLAESVRRDLEWVSANG